MKKCNACNHTCTKDPNHCDSLTCFCVCWNKRDKLKENTVVEKIGINSYTFDKARDELFTVNPDKTLCSHFIVNSESEILEYHEKAKKYDDLMNTNHEIVQNNISHTQIHQENKQFREKIGNIIADNHCKSHYTIELEYEFEKLKEKLEQIKTIFDDGSVDDDTFFPKLKEILGGSQK